MKIWCLINKYTDKIIPVEVIIDGGACWVSGFKRKKDLMVAMDVLEYDEEAVRVDVEIPL